MASGSRRTRANGDEYVFIDGKAMRADEVVRIDVGDVAAPGQAEAASVPGAAEAGVAGAKPKRRLSAREALNKMEKEDAFAVRDDAFEGLVSFEKAESLMADDRRKMRTKYLIFGIVLAVVALLSFCISGSYSWKLYSPAEVISAFGKGIQITFAQITSPANYSSIRASILNNDPFVLDICGHAFTVVKYILCGALLAVAGMLYQNTFRNPIAAPSMLGVTNGVNIALLIMVLVFGAQAASMVGVYYICAYVGGAAVLILVLLGGKWISGKGNFNVVNMILMGTIISQLLGVVSTYIQNMYINESEWLIYYNLQAATTADSIYTWATLLIGFVAALAPVFIFRFKLNLVSFSDAETRLLGVDPNKLRILALVCGSVMVLTAQVNAGQVAMASLVVPFVVRAVFGAEFRKQLWGNILVGALLILVCGDISTYVLLWGTTVDLGSIVTIVAMPLFVWMLAVRQRSWE